MDPSFALPLVDKWGPSIRTISRIRRLPDAETAYEMKAQTAAQAIAASPHSINVLDGSDKTATSEGSTIVFYRPNRFEKNGRTVSIHGIPFIPTRYLLDIFEHTHLLSTNEKALDLFFALSSHALTRHPYGWYHEKRMHTCMCAGGPTLEIFQKNGHHVRKHIQPSSTLLPGTKSKLKHSHTTQSYYWMPSAVNFAGIDGLLRNGNDIYTLQATVVQEAHREPSAGIKAVWGALPSDYRADYTWHFVVVSDNEEAANMHLKTSVDQLKTFTLGVGGRKTVAVWACILPS